VNLMPPSLTPARCSLLTLLLIAGVALPVAAAAGGQSPPPARTGEELYDTACAACHGKDGRGAPPHPVGFEIPLPDFTDCAFTTPEADWDWMAQGHDGGPARGFDYRMPAFGDVLTGEEIQLIVSHMRTFCTSDAWPRGDLNLPRAFVTEKAFPENEFVLTTSIATSGTGSVSNEFLYEKRFGPRAQIEAKAPVDLAEGENGPWVRGLGDIAFAFKYAAFHSIRTGSIFSVVGEVILPTGKESLGLGKGVTIFEPFVAFGQLFAGETFVQIQTGAELSTDREKSQNEVFFRTAIGKTFNGPPNGFGRAWSPMVEFVAAHEVEEGAPFDWDIIPEMQVTLSRRHHVRINLGYRTPLNNRTGRDSAFLVYFLWDWFDGGLFEGWR